jgi:hypothetical protein
MGHFLHGTSLAFPNQVLRYGFLTISGRTGGVRVEASTTLARSAEEATTTAASGRIVYGQWVERSI